MQVILNCMKLVYGNTITNEVGTLADVLAVINAPAKAIKFAPAPEAVELEFAV